MCENKTKWIRLGLALSVILLSSCDGEEHGEAGHRCPPPPEVTVCHLSEYADAIGVDVTDIDFDPEDVLYRHAAQLNMLALKNAEDEYRRNNPNCPYYGARLAQSAESPPCPRREDFTDDQMAGLRAAQAFHQGAPRWWHRF